MTDDEIALDNFAHELNGRLIGSAFEVVAGGKNGPITLIVKGLSPDDVEDAIRALCDALVIRTERHPKH